MTLLAELLSLKRDPVTEKELELALEYLGEKARANFHLFRRAIHGRDFIDGWFPRKLSEELQEFHDAYHRGEAPCMVVQSPPQHGKSQAIIDYLAYALGADPSNRIILGSFSDRLGIRANKAIKRIMEQPVYKIIFPGVRVPSGTGAERRLSNTDNFFELPGEKGSFRNVTCGGSVTGESADLAVIDDPVKGREAANSATVREKTWEWWTDDWSTRLQERSAQLIILTRWSVDDLVGRILERDSLPGLKLVTYPAIAMKDEEYRKTGEALFPEFKSLDFLNKQKKKRDKSSWESLYQQSPTIQGGNLLKHAWLRFTPTLPKPERIFLTADTASKTKEENDYTVIQAWAYRGGNIYLYDMIRDKMEAPQLLRAARDFYIKHQKLATRAKVPLTWFYIEDASSGIGLIQTLRGEHFRVKGITRGKDKVQRANDIAPYIENGQVWILETCPHVSDFETEYVQFPAGKNDDTIDPLMDACDQTFTYSPDFFCG